MAMSPIDLEKLRADLSTDASQAQERASSAFATRGAPEETSFAPKALRIKGRAFGQAELDGATQGIEKLISHLKTEAAFKDQTEAGVFESNMRKKLNQYKMAAIRQAGEVDKKMAKAGIERAQREKVLKGLSGLSEAAAFSIALGIGAKGPDTPVADSMQSPTLGSQFTTQGPSLSGGLDLGGGSVQPDTGMASSLGVGNLSEG